MDSNLKNDQYKDSQSFFSIKAICKHFISKLIKIVFVNITYMYEILLK